MASTKRSWRSEVHRRRCLALSPEGVGLFTEEPPLTIQRLQAPQSSGVREGLSSLLKTSWHDV
ncbi:hypothetical protein Pyn_18000 [Prunus yedoensis var. nudiflora]|uniref:Uncharacterized protein n=1 Tax=Prunus yedoensis var. nudiflora TaxID=2094558 RepID=A0A314Y576_PRUYE|nr:hypothetical protein Pyn_18000 [Prunus yedoensis var. nudiflora]